MKKKNFIFHHKQKFFLTRKRNTRARGKTKKNFAGELFVTEAIVAAKRSNRFTSP